MASRMFLLFFSLSLSLLSSFHASAQILPNVCVVAQGLFFTGDVVTGNCTQGANTTLCEVYRSLGTTQDDVSTLQADVVDIDTMLVDLSADLSVERSQRIAAVTAVNTRIDIIVPYLGNGSVVDLPCNGSFCELWEQVQELTNGSLGGYMTLSTAQTASGAKTFTAPVVLAPASNQLVLQPGGTGNTITLTATNPLSSVVYTIPDVFQPASFVMTAAAQTIGGLKTFSGQITFSSTPSSGQLAFNNGGNSLFVAFIPPANADHTVTLPDTGTADRQFLLTGAAVAQTVVSTINFGLAPKLTGPTTQLIIQPNGSGNQFTITATNPALSRAYTLPDAGGAASFVMSAGTQVLTGPTTFTAAVTLAASSGQLVVQPGGGVGTKYTMTMANPSADRVITLVDPLADANLLLSQGSQAVDGAWTFHSTVTLTDTANQLVLQPGAGTGTTITLTATNPISSVVYTIPDVFQAASFVMTAAAQTIGGLKTFSGQTTFTSVPTSGQLAFNNGGNTLFLSLIPPAQADHTVTLPDVGTVDRQFLLTGALTAQTVVTTLIFSAAPKLTAGTTQLIIQPNGSGNQFNINAANPGATRTYTLPDAGGAASFVMSAGTQTITGATTFSATVTLTAPSNQLVFTPGANSITLTAASPASSVTYTLPDVAQSASFVMTQGTQTVSGLKTFAGQLTFTSAAPAGQFVFNSGVNNLFLQFVTPAQADHTVTLPDVGSLDRQFLLTGASASQTVVTTMLFSAAPKLTGPTTQLIIQPNGAGTQFNIAAANPGVTHTYTLPDAGAAASFVLTAGTQTLTGLTTFSAAVTLTAPSNQLVFTPGANSITLTAASPSTSVTYTLPDVGGAASFVMTAGAQTVAGAKTLSSALTLTATSNQLVFTPGANSITLTAASPASSITYTLPDVAQSASFVMTQGTQTISGLKTFAGQTTFTSGALSGQFVFNSGVNNLFIIFTTPASADHTITVPDTGTGDRQFLLTGASASQTVTSVMIFQGAPKLTASSNQLSIQPSGSGNTFTITATNPAASRTYTLPDAGGAASFVMTAGAQTLSGATTLSGGAIFANTAGGTGTLTHYSTDTSGSVTITWQGCVTTATSNMYWQRIGITVFVTFSYWNAAILAGGTWCSSTTAVFPAELRPAHIQIGDIGAIQNTAAIVGSIRVNTDGTIWLGGPGGSTINNGNTGTTGICAGASTYCNTHYLLF
jgi:predicted secreted Zn-dependent protease